MKFWFNQTMMPIPKSTMNPIKTFITTAIFFLAATTFAADINELALIPAPQKIQRSDGAFTLTADTLICLESGRTKPRCFLPKSCARQLVFLLRSRKDSFPGHQTRMGFSSPPWMPIQILALRAMS